MNGSLLARGVAPHAVDEAVRRRVDVEEARRSGPWVAEPVPHTRWSSDERAGPDAHDLVADRELELALEDVEGVELVRVDMWIDRAEVRLARELDDLELLALGLDDEVAVLSRDGFALAGA